MSYLRLEVGKRYVTRHGRIVTILGKVVVKHIKYSANEPQEVFEGDNKILYHQTGFKLDEDTLKDSTAFIYYEDLVFSVRH